MAGPFYVQPGIGNDGNAGTSRGAGNSWATLQKGADTATAGEIVYCEGTETLAATTDFNTNSGDETSGMIRFIGTNTSGVNDGTYYILDGDSAAVNCIKGDDKDYIHLENFELKNATGDGIAWATSCNFWFGNNISSHNNGTHGFDCTDADESIFIRCTSYLNTDGVNLTSNNFFFLFSSMHDNTQSGVVMPNTTAQVFIGCLIYDNGNDGIEDIRRLSLILNCVIDGNTDDGVLCQSAASSGIKAVIGSRITNHSVAGDIGLNCNTEIVYHGWNYFEDNNGDNIQNATIAQEILYNGATTDQEDQADTNEGYTDLTGGAEDFNLRSDATLRRTAIAIPTA